MSLYIKWFNELSIEDVDLVGGKNASLGEMYQDIIAESIRKTYLHLKRIKKSFVYPMMMF